MKTSKVMKGSWLYKSKKGNPAVALVLIVCHCVCFNISLLKLVGGSMYTSQDSQGPFKSWALSILNHSKLPFCKLLQSRKLGVLLERLSTEQWYRYGLFRNGSTSWPSGCSSRLLGEKSIYIIRPFPGGFWTQILYKYTAGAFCSFRNRELSWIKDVASVVRLRISLAVCSGGKWSSKERFTTQRRLTSLPSFEAHTPLCCGLPRHGSPVINKHLGTCSNLPFWHWTLLMENECKYMLVVSYIVNDHSSCFW